MIFSKTFQPACISKFAVCGVKTYTRDSLLFHLLVIEIFGDEFEFVYKSFIENLSAMLVVSEYRFSLRKQVLGSTKYKFIKFSLSLVNCLYIQILYQLRFLIL